MPRSFLIWFWSMLLTACAGGGVSPNLDHGPSPTTLAALVAYFGPAYARETLTDGGAIVVWKHAEQIIEPPGWTAPGHSVHASGNRVVSSTTPGEFIPPKWLRLSCEFRFFLDGEERVTGLDARGPECQEALLRHMRALGTAPAN